VDSPIDLQALVREVNEALILAVLRDGAKHGYQIALDVSDRTDGAFAFQHGTLYPILHRLEKDGLIAGDWSEGEGRRRKDYRLTPAGRGQIEQLEGRFDRAFQTLRRLLREDDR
jgi:DNA-binding PadR family transcriptional regulator